MCIVTVPVLDGLPSGIDRCSLTMIGVLDGLKGVWCEDDFIMCGSRRMGHPVKGALNRLNLMVNPWRLPSMK
jgi:hypothetical protein